MPLDYDAPPSGAAVAPSGPAVPIDRSSVAAAVERYLAARGIPTGPVSPVSPVSSTLSNVAAEVVERFLAARGASTSKSGFS